MLDRLDETIVAVSSAPGRGAVGIVRLTGPAAVAVAERLAVLDGPVSAVASWSRAGGEVAVGGRATVPAWLYVFREPASYTGQDLIEVHTVGGPAVLSAVRRAALSAGARPAEPGEFTARAFVNGRVDLASAEGVAAVIQARSDAQLRAARLVLDGALSRSVGEVRAACTELTALVEADIDFAEEPIEFITPAELQRRLAELQGRLVALARDALPAEQPDDRPRVLLLGPPNAGKSTLLNRLSGSNRAICTPAAGTTRDVLSAEASLAGREVLLLDAAGVTAADLRSAAWGASIVAQTIAQTRSAVGGVDAVCLVGDLSDAVSMQQVASLAREVEGLFCIVGNKADVVPAGERAARLQPVAGVGDGCALVASALTDEGCPALATALAALLGGTSAEGQTVALDALVLTDRQRAALVEAEAGLGRAIELASTARETIDAADLLAFELRGVLAALGTLTGEVVTDDLLQIVFGRFCIGK